MSLDVYLRQPGVRLQRERSGIFVRENGETKEISREEWDERNPGHEPVVADVGPEETDEVYSANITHNLGKMAAAAGIYEHLWRPEEIGVTKADDLVVPLTLGLERLLGEPHKFRALNPENGWGNYEGLVRFVERYLDACREFPEADVSVSR